MLVLVLALLVPVLPLVPRLRLPPLLPPPSSPPPLLPLPPKLMHVLVLVLLLELEPPSLLAFPLPPLLLALPLVDAYVRKAAHAPLHNLSKAFGPIIMQPVYS